MRRSRGAPFVSALAVAGLSVLAGCTQLQTHDLLADLTKDRQGATTQPDSGQDSRAVPRECDGRLPSYAIVVSDVLTIRAAVKGSNADATDPFPSQLISGQYAVEANGTVDLGVWGSVLVADLSLAEAPVAVRKQLERAPLPAPVAKNITIEVDVHTYGRRCYVITEGLNKTEQVHEFPLTGREGALDAIVSVDGLAQVASKRAICLKRRTDQPEQSWESLPIDWVEITKMNNTKTNYTLQHGDRIYVTTE